MNVDKFTMQSGAEAVKTLVTAGEEFDGVFCVTDTIAIGVLRGLADLGVSVPSSVKVIGFDNVEECNFTVPSLSSVDPDHELMARTAVSLLIRRIDDGTPGHDHQEFVSNFTVVERESTSTAASPGRPRAPVSRLRERRADSGAKGAGSKDR